MTGKTNRCTKLVDRSTIKLNILKGFSAMNHLTKPVGKGVHTAPHDKDVLLVQQLLNKSRSPTLGPIGEDGTIGPKTIAAIEEFQRRVVRMPVPDGRVDPNGATIRALSSQVSAMTSNPFGWNLEKAVQHSSTYGNTSLSRCAEYVRNAIEAGGVTLTRTNSAKDYGPSLTKVGFKVTSTSVYQRGDVVIMQGFTRHLPGKCSHPNHGDNPHDHPHPHGHIQMFNGTKWISDFAQNDFWPGEDYRVVKPSFIVYRFGLLGDFNSAGNTSRFA